MKRLFFILCACTLFVLPNIFCGDGEDKKQQSTTTIEGGLPEDIAYQPQRDMSNQEFIIEQRKMLAKTRFPGDTINLMEHVLKAYPEGTYLVDFDKKSTMSTPRSAVIYKTIQGKKYVFGVIAKSKPGERLIEIKNIIGYDQSFIDLDSTKLGTAFFYLNLFEIVGDSSFNEVWSVPIPSHGGFGELTYEKWAPQNIDYIRCYYYWALGVGHFDFNYFMVDGLLKTPHLLLTYEGINFKREMMDVNKDRYPDYLESAFQDTGDQLRVFDQVPFVWKPEDTLYVNTRNPHQTRKY